VPSPADDPVVQIALGRLICRVEEEWERSAVPGLALVVVCAGEILALELYGWADLETRRPVEPDTLFRIGSISKLFTATALLALRDDGRLSLDDPLQRWIPELSPQCPRGDVIRLRAVAAHLAGLPREAPLPYFETLDFPDDETLLRSLRGFRPVAPPWSESIYSNVGYALLGIVLGRASGHPFERLVKDRILTPLGMESCGFTVAQGAKRATGYLPAPARRQSIPAPDPDIRAFRPAGGMVASPSGLARFMLGQLREEWSGSPLPGSLREMRSPIWLASDWSSATGLGWHLTRAGGYTVVGHDGGTHGFGADLRLVPALGLGVAVCANSRPAPTDLTMTALEMLIPALEAADPA
jgi:CubicO group peptidase (beta-lactamase class C family)